MPRLYYGCARKYEENTEHANARKMYETFLSIYPEHALAKEVEYALARIIVKQAKASSAGEIPQPESSGSTTSGVVKIVIQNTCPSQSALRLAGHTHRLRNWKPVQPVRNMASGKRQCTALN